MSPAIERALLRAALRADFMTFLRKAFHTLNPGQVFVPEWHLEAIAYQLERIMRGEIRRLIINMPPRSLKSLTCSVAFPAFVHGLDPTKRIVCASYAGDLARKLANDYRALIISLFYRELFPGTRIGRKDSEGEIELTARGIRFATSVGGTLTGRGGSLVIIDDPLKASDAMSDQRRGSVNDWYGGTLSSRFDDKRASAVIIVMQRLHMDDLTGYLRERSDDWEILSLPAIAEHDQRIPIGPNRFHLRRQGEVLSLREPMAELERLKRDLGSDHFSAQYQQAPVPPGGAMIKRHWVQRYSDPPLPQSGDFIVQSWDTASKGGPDNDWSVCTTWRVRDQQYFLIDVWRGRVDYPALKDKVGEMAETWSADQVLIEEAGTAIALLAELRLDVSGITGVTPERDKATRMSVASAKFEAGQVFLPAKAEWLGALETELFSFPGSKHDDQVDSISQALNQIASSGMSVWNRLGAMA